MKKCCSQVYTRHYVCEHCYNILSADMFGDWVRDLHHTSEITLYHQIMHYMSITKYNNNSYNRMYDISGLTKYFKYKDKL